MRRLTLLLLLSLLGAITTAQTYSDLYRNTPKGGPVSSGKLPELTVYNAECEKLQLRAICKDRYTLLVMGCITCPEFRRLHPSVEAVNIDYSPLGVQTFYIYKNLRHPELGGYVEAQNIAERQLMVAEIKGLLGGDVEWLIDDMSNNISQSLLSGSRSAYLISPQGEIITAWAAPDEDQLRQSLTSVVGAPSKRTSVEQLNLPTPARVVKNSNIDSANTIERGDGMVILKSIPNDREAKYYVKMRAEADAQLLSCGTGRLALGFFPDPIYDAHWNNLAEQMKYTLTLPDGIKASPAEASAKRGRGDSDSEPRQFWVDIKGALPADSIVVTYHYYGCTPDICEALTHAYTIYLTPEAQGASTFGFNKGTKGGGSRVGQGGGQRNGGNYNMRGGQSNQHKFR